MAFSSYLFLVVKLKGNMGERRASSSDGRLHVTQKLNHTESCEILTKKAVLSQGNRAMPQLFFSV